MSFHGSYRPTDVEFLLKPISMTFVHNVLEKEEYIQSGHKHYSEMLSPERLPSTLYREIFFSAHAANRARLARDCLRLASHIVEHHGTRPTIVSLARAGTPVGAIVRHLIDTLHSSSPKHFSLSIIRDRGIDTVAIDRILASAFEPASIAFVDGWTGKGVISQELENAICAYNSSNGVDIDSGLYVISDLAGTAAYAASDEDYLISSSILNSTISGLISRSVLNDLICPGDFHGCVFYEEFRADDLSCWFVDDVVSAALEIVRVEGMPDRVSSIEPGRASRRSDFLESEMFRRGIHDRNHVKPGIGEATRVLLRRKPGLVIVRDAGQDCVAHLLMLAQEKGVPVEVLPSLPYNALSFIGTSQNV